MIWFYFLSLSLWFHTISKSREVCRAVADFAGKREKSVLLCTKSKSVLLPFEYRKDSVGLCLYVGVRKLVHVGEETAINIFSPPPPKRLEHIHFIASICTNFSASCDFPVLLPTARGLNN